MSVLATPLLATPSQTVGPFFAFGLPYGGGPRVAPEWHPDAIRIHGVVYDGEGAPVPDALLETWQAGPDGTPPATPGALVRDGHDFSGFGRCPTDADGHYWFSTLKPGGPAPHVAVTLFARGLLRQVNTRIYFPGEAGNDTDPVLSGIPADRRGTLVATRDGDRSYRFDVRLQGDGETVFFAV
jgi:protocatechuate 3,4-dioxygenase alpha subunit